jgi:hypothetical protein
MLSLGDFCLLHKEIAEDRPLPIVQVESLSSASVLCIDRHGRTYEVPHTVIIKLDGGYMERVWDEVIDLEKRILFTREAIEKPGDFRLSRSRGLIKVLGGQKVTSINSPDSSIVHEHNRDEPLTAARLAQLTGHLTSYEDSHDFLVDALNFSI